MRTIAFDTLRFAEWLRMAIVPEAQSKAEAEALRDVLSEALDAPLVTRADIVAAKSELKIDITALGQRGRYPFSAIPHRSTKPA